MPVLRSFFLLILFTQIRNLYAVTFISPVDDELIPAGSPYTVTWSHVSTDPTTFDLYLTLGYLGSVLSINFINTVSTNVGSYIWTPSVADASVSTEAWLSFNNSGISNFEGATYLFTIVVPAVNSPSPTPTTITPSAAEAPTSTSNSSPSPTPTGTTISEEQGLRTSSISSSRSLETIGPSVESSSLLGVDSSKATVTNTSWKTKKTGTSSKATVINTSWKTETTGKSSKATSTPQSASGSSNQADHSDHGLPNVAKAGIGAGIAAILITLLIILGVVLYWRRRSMKISERVLEKHAFAKAELSGSDETIRPPYVNKNSDTSITGTPFSTESPSATAPCTQPELAVTPIYRNQESSSTQRAELAACITNPASELADLESEGFAAYGTSPASELRAPGRAEFASGIDIIAHELSGHTNQATRELPAELSNSYSRATSVHHLVELPVNRVVAELSS